MLLIDSIIFLTILRKSIEDLLHSSSDMLSVLWTSSMTTLMHLTLENATFNMSGNY